MAQQPWFDGDTAGWVPALRLLLGAGGGYLDPTIITDRNWIRFDGRTHEPMYGRNRGSISGQDRWRPADGHDNWNRLTLYRPVQNGPRYTDRYFQIVHAEFVFWASDGGGYDMSPARQGQELIAVSRGVVDPLPRNEVLQPQSFRDTAEVLRALLTWASGPGNDALTEVMTGINDGGSGFEGSAAQALWWTLADVQFGLTDLQDIIEVPDSWPVRLDESAAAVDTFMQGMRNAWSTFTQYQYHDPNWMVHAVIDAIMTQVEQDFYSSTSDATRRYPDPDSPWNFSLPGDLGGNTYDLASPAGWSSLDFDLRWLWGNEFRGLETAASQATAPLVTSFSSLDEAFTRGVRDVLHLPRPDGMVPDPTTDTTDLPDLDGDGLPDGLGDGDGGAPPPPDLTGADGADGLGDGAGDGGGGGGGDGGGAPPPPDLAGAEVPDGLGAGGGGGGGAPPPDLAGADGLGGGAPPPADLAGAGGADGLGGAGIGGGAVPPDLAGVGGSGGLGGPDGLGGGAPPTDIPGAGGLGGLGGGGIPPTDIPGTDLPGGTGGPPPLGGSGGDLGGGLGGGGVVPPALGGAGGLGGLGGSTGGGGTRVPDLPGAGVGGARPGAGLGRPPTLTDPGDIGSPGGRQVGPDELGGSTGGGVIGPLGNPPPSYTPPGSLPDQLAPGYGSAGGGAGALGAAGGGGLAGAGGGGLAGLAGAAGAGAGGPGGVAGAGAGAPFTPMPMPMGGGGMGGGGAGQSEREREKTVWLAEDESVWGTDPTCPPSVVGADESDEWEYEGTRRSPSVARPGSSQPYEPARGRPRAQS